MSWTNIDLKSISLQVDLIPEGKYTFEVSPGAHLNDKGTLLMQARVSQDGEFKGKPVFFSYPDPESISAGGKVNSWSGVAFKRLEQALGVDCNDGETAESYAQRVAGSRFTGTITHSPVTDEYPTPRINLNLFKVAPAA